MNFLEAHGTASSATIYRMLAATDLTDELARITCPTLVIGGRFDRTRSPQRPSRSPVRSRARSSRFSTAATTWQCRRRSWWQAQSRSFCIRRVFERNTDLVIPEAERSEAIGNPAFQGGGYWIPRSPP
jgi:hypothetical protein